MPPRKEETSAWNFSSPPFRTGPCSVLPGFLLCYISSGKSHSALSGYMTSSGHQPAHHRHHHCCHSLAAGALTLTRCDSQYVACLPTPRHKTRFAPGCPAHESEIFFERCHSHGNRQSQQHGRRPYQQVRIYRAGPGKVNNAGDINRRSD